MPGRAAGGANAGAAPFVPRSGGSAPGGAPAVAFLRGATRGGVPVPAGALGPSSAEEAALPGEDAFYEGPSSASMPRPRGGPRALLGPDGVPFLAPAPASAAEAEGPMGGGYAALPPARPAASRPGLAPHGARFGSDALRQELQRRAQLCAAQLPPGSEEAERVPPLLHRFHSLVPLEDALAEEAPSGALGLRTAVTKALSMDDGCAYVLRRLDGAALPPTPAAVAAAAECVARWAPLAAHPHACGLRGVFAADPHDAGSGQGQPCMYVVHDYAPGAATLAAAHCARGAPGAREDALWAVAVQCAAALRAVHAAGLAARSAALAPSKVLLTTGGRVRLAALGLPDALAAAAAAAAAAAQGAPPPPPPSGEALRQLQRGDLVSLGRLLLQLAAGAGPASLPLLAQRCSPRLTQLVAALLEGGAPGGGGPAAIRDTGALGAALGDASLAALTAAGAGADALLAEAAREADAGRALRCVMKLSFVLERGGDDASDGVSHGDRYLLQLFRDWLFNAPSADGARRADWGHAYEALAKLDAGVPERILLLSQDEASMLVASYADIKRCVEQAYAQMEQAAARADAEQRAMAMAAGASEYSI